MKDKLQGKKYFFKSNENFCINDLNINPFLIPHDAAEPCGFNILNDNKKLSIATDLGHIDGTIISSLEGASSVILESNYDPNILKYSNYPYNLKRRIAGPSGHLENKDCGKAISFLTHSNLSNALLVHLSKENNFPELAYKTVCEEIHNTSNISLSVAPRNEPSKVFKVI